MMTLRPLGPRVDLTASASWSTPDSSRLRASAPNRSSLAMGPPGCVRMAGYGDEDRPAAHLAGVEVVQRLLGGVERVGLGVQRDLAGLGQHHQLGELVVGADDVADDVALGRDDVQRRQRAAAAVADDDSTSRPARVIAKPSFSAPCSATKSSTTSAPVAAGEILHGVHLLAVGDHGVVGAERLGQLERVRVAVDDDDVRRGQRGRGTGCRCGRGRRHRSRRRSCPGRAAGSPCAPRGRP